MRNHDGAVRGTQALPLDEHDPETVRLIRRIAAFKVLSNAIEIEVREKK